MDLYKDNENDVLCEKIINEIYAVFLRDPNLSSFEIIPKELNCNISPVKHIEHHLGLESWCAKHIYVHAVQMIMSYRRQHSQRYLQQSDTLVKYLNVALLINPDVTSFWHIRRQLVQINSLKINPEFKFSALILSKKPKSNEAFAYRRWLFSFQSFDAIDWHNEIGICDRCADRSSSNYHAWSHRQWVLQNASSSDIIKSELMRSGKFMAKHISDYSSYHYRQTVITYAYDMCYHDEDELQQMDSLRELIKYYLNVAVCSDDEILETLLPGLRKKIGAKRLKSFLYCCNLAAHDILLCDAQRNIYGEHESFELHRRASLKFIVEQCVHLLAGEKCDSYIEPLTPSEARQFNVKLHSFDYTTHTFLDALQRSEGMLGEKHRKWCTIFLGFNYATATT